MSLFLLVRYCCGVCRHLKIPPPFTQSHPICYFPLSYILLIFSHYYPLLPLLYLPFAFAIPFFSIIFRFFSLSYFPFFTISLFYFFHLNEKGQHSPPGGSYFLTFAVSGTVILSDLIKDVRA